MSSAPRGAVPRWLALALAFLIGTLTAVQARINGALSAEIGDGLLAATVSFGTGLAILLVLSAVLPSGRRGVARLRDGLRERGIPVWMLLGGIAGALTVATQGLTVATVGVAMFTVGLVAGQTVSGLLLDRAGFGPAGVVPVTMPRVTGAGLVVVSVAFGLVGAGMSEAPWWMLVLPLLAGAGIAWQQGTNGRLRQLVGTPLTATLVNFVGGTVVLVLVLALRIAVGPAFEATPPSEPWYYLGGALGVVYIFVSAALVRVIGVLLLGIGSIVGLLTTSLLIDALWPPAGGGGLLPAVLAVAVALVGAVVAVLPPRRR